MRAHQMQKWRVRAKLCPQRFISNRSYKRDRTQETEVLLAECIPVFLNRGPGRHRDGVCRLFIFKVTGPSPLRN